MIIVLLIIVLLIIVCIKILWPVTSHFNIEKIQQVHTFNKKIVVCFLVRDGDKYLEKNLTKMIDFLHNNFKTYHILYVENDSKDNTLNILKTFEQYYPISGISLKLSNLTSVDMCKKENEYNCNKRTRFLTKLRQILVNKVKSEFYNYDYMLMTDMDFIDFNNKHLLTMFKIAINNNYEAIFGVSHKNGKLYDTGTITPSFTRFLYKYYKYNQSITTVDSAFSGFGIYSIRSLIEKNIQYNLKTNKIEHIDFNRKLDTYVYNGFTPEY